MVNFTFKAKSSILISFLTIVSLLAKADAGLFRQFVILNKGTGNEYLGNPMSSNFNNVNLGSFCSTSTLILNGAEINTWQNGSDDVNCSNFCPRMYYRVYLKNTTPGSFSTITLGFVSESGSDKKWDKTNSNINLLSGLSSGTYVIEVYFEANFTWCCGNADRLDNNGGNNYKAEFTVTTAPNAGTLSGTASVCLSGTTTFTSDGNSGGTWSSASTSVATINASSGLITPVGTGSSIITYSVTGTGGCSNATATRTVNVTANPNAGTLSGTQTVCVSGTTTFTSSGESGGTWSSDNTSVATVNSSSGVITGVSSGTATITYTVSAAGCSSSSTTLTVTVNSNPSAPSGSATQSFCNSATVADLTATGTALKWYSLSSGGTSLSSSTALSNGNTYYATQTVSSCESSSRFAVAVTISPTITWANIKSANTSICSGSAATIEGEVYIASVTNNSSNSSQFTVQYAVNGTNSDPSGWSSPSAINWTTLTSVVSANNNLVYTGSIGSSLQAGTYYVSIRYRTTNCATWVYGGTASTGGAQGSGGPWNGTTNLNYVLTVNSTAAPSASASQTFCSGATVSSLSATGSTIQWYAASSSGSALSGSTALVNGTKYYATQTANSCESQTRTEVTATVNARPSAPSGATGGTICASGTTSLSVTSPGAGFTIDWYAASSGGSVLSGGSGTASFTTPSISTTTIYHAETRNTTTSCVSSSRTAVTATVNSDLDFFNLQSPQTATISLGGSAIIYGQVYELGITDVGGQQGAGIDVEFGVSPVNTNSNPNTWTTWNTATYLGNGGGTANDEYTGNLTGLPVGTHYYTFRYRRTGCEWRYGGFSSGGSSPWNWNGTTISSGTITVTPAPLITINSSSLTSFGSVCASSNSTSQPYTVSGSDLEADVTVTAPSGYQVSSDNSTFSSSISLTRSGTTLGGAVTIYVRLASGAAGSVPGTISHTSTNATTQNVSVTGTRVSAGTWIGVSGNWNVAGNWCGGIPSSTTDVEIPSGVTVTLDAASAAKSVTIAGTLLGSSNTLTVSGNWTNNGSFTAGTGTVNFATAGTVSGGNATTFNNLTINTGELTLTTRPTINGTFEIKGGTLSAAPNYGSSSTLYYNVSSYGRFEEWTPGVLSNPGYPNNVVIGSSATGCTFSANNTPALYLRGDLTIGAASGASSSFTLNDNSANPRPLLVGGNVVINATGTLTLGNINGANAGDIYVGGDWTRNGTFNANSRGVFFNKATGDQTINNAETFAYLLVDKSTSGNLYLAENVTVSEDLTLTTSNNARLVVNAGKRLTFKNGYFNADPVTLKSDATGTASIGAITGTLNGATNVTVERYVQARRKWRALTTPLVGSSNNSIYANWQNGGTANGSTGAMIWSPSAGSGVFSGGASSSLLSYNSGSNNWTAITNTSSENLFTSSGNNSYVIFVTGPYNSDGSYVASSSGAAATTLRATGTLRKGTVTLSNLGTASNQFVLIGNPFASAVNLKNVSKSGYTQFAYTWDPSMSTYGGYQTINTTAGTDAENTIESGQAVFFQTTSTTNSIAFEEQDKVSGSSNGYFRMSESNNNPQIKIDLNKYMNGALNKYDVATFDFIDGANAGVDGEDALKPEQFYENMSISRDGKDLSWETRPSITSTDELPLRMWKMQQANYQLKINTANINLPADATAVLEDRFLNKQTPLNINGTTLVDFSVTPDVASSGNRFRIVFRNNAITPVTNINAEKGFAIYPNPVAKGSNMQLQFRNRAAGKYTVSVFTITGMRVQQNVVRHNGGTSVQPIGIEKLLSAGNYLVEIMNEKGEKDQVKLIVE